MDQILAILELNGCKVFFDVVGDRHRMCFYPPSDPLRKAIIGGYHDSKEEAFNAVNTGIPAEYKARKE